MNKVLIFFIAFEILALQAKAQNPPRQSIDLDELIERLFPVQDEELDYESIYEVLLQLYLNPLDLNQASAEELQQFFLLNQNQINSLLNYREKFGPFLTLYELQAIPGFDMELIESIVPFFTLQSTGRKTRPFLQRLQEEEQAYFLFRSRRVWQTRRGFTAADTSSTGRISSRYLGDPNDLYLRFRIQHPRDFSLGFTLDKDAGEQFIWDRKSARYGFNFFSYHFTRYEVGNWKTITLGDYQASFGQGLVFGAGYSLGKGVETVPTARRSSIGLIPYTAALEFGFFRGIAATRKLGKWNSTVMFSYAPRDGRIDEALDSLENEPSRFSSLNQSGLHRTASELSTKNQLRELSLGTNLNYTSSDGRWNSGLNFLHTQFGTTWQRDPRPYNQYEFAGKSNQLGSIYWSWNWKNINFFSESAISKSGGKAILAGMLTSLDPKIDLSVLWRKYDRDFHSFYGNAFSENTRPINEQGTYLGLEIRPHKNWKINSYYDFFRFPWLKFRVYAPSNGFEWLSRVTFSPFRELSTYLQIRQEQKDRNLTDSGEPQLTYTPLPIDRINGMWGLEYQVNPQLFIRSRILWSRVKQIKDPTHGFLIYQDIRYAGNRWKISGRYALFDALEYDNRLYAFENNVLWTFSIPALFGQGQRYYLLGEFDLGRKLTFYFRYAKTTYTDRNEISSGLQQIEGNTISETTFMIRYLFNR
ncbi:helix-hairpin-helix domain-containing protein [Algoriphagus hitonicola]|uniref:Helix-hairpin-helix motif-containing protein n=1 Tax=Algoriphagus hitonicola TaxID=435880 RepID=A0A1I2TYZ6_9BACT|nr:helix-hairpin-helix domain-containing protein [Algoriphagus hitonicola]SFG67581.1 Helix-hairpin-helix motif-containing protein [Algoriphagus hitonicola]